MPKLFQTRLRSILIFGIVCSAACFAALAQNSLPKVAIARWPGDKKAAISLTFDDAMNTHLDRVRPILKKHQLVGTFFATTGKPEWKNRKPEWQALAAEGNEIGNHTVNHPCLLEIIEPHSQDYTPEMMEAEIRDAAAEITATTNSHRGLTFAYPCGNMSFGRPADQAKNEGLYLTFVSRYAFGARGAVGSGGTEDPDEMDVLTVSDLGITEAKDSAALIAMAEPAVTAKNWGIFCFHGVGGEYLSITSEALDGLAGYLQQHPEIWTASFGDVLRYTLERKAASIEVKPKADGSVDILLSWPMPHTTYDIPLTLMVDIPPSWAGVSVLVDGKPGHPETRQPNRALLIGIPAGTAVANVAPAVR